MKVSNNKSMHFARFVCLFGFCIEKERKSQVKRKMCSYLDSSLLLWHLAAQVIEQLNATVLPSEIRSKRMCTCRMIWMWIENQRVNYFRSVGYLVTSVVDRLIGRCMARRLASSGTNSTPPVIIQLRCLLHFGGILPSLISFDATFSADVTAFSLFACDPDFVEKYFALQSQKQFAQHCDGNLTAADCLSGWLVFLWFDLNGDSSNSSNGAWLCCVLFRSMVCRSVWSVHPLWVDK